MSNKYYWDKDSNALQLEEQLNSIAGIKEIFIVSAFLSNHGVEMLKRLARRNAVPKEKVVICLSAEFSDEKPAELLQTLSQVATIRISRGDRLFHPKLYYIKGQSESILIFGSSNFTLGGFEKNIEFDNICTPTAEDIEQLEKFKAYCFSQTDILTTERIEFYKEQETALAELKKAKEEINRKLKRFVKRQDPFDEQTYDLTGYYFQFADYETFFDRNQSLSSIGAIGAQRKAVQTKLLDIHRTVERKIAPLNLYPHWEKSNTTSLTFPTVFNHNKVGWLGVRYWKREQLDFARLDKKDPFTSITKHTCLQYCISSSLFEVNLFFAVPNGSWDRASLHEYAKMAELAPRINEQAEKLRGNDLTWIIQDCESYNLDMQSSLAEYLRKNDKDGRFSYLSLSFKPDDEKIKTFDGICDEIVKGIKLLKPLFDIIVWQPKKT